MRSLFLALAASVLVLVPACGKKAEAPASPAASPAAIPAHVWPQEISDLTPDPAVRFGQLDNGMRYIIMPNDTPPQTASLRLRIDMGSLYEADDQQGLAHFLEHMAFNGSASIPEGEMVRILERNGLAFGPDTNAFTSFDQTVYQLDLPSVSADMLDTGLFIMRETAGNLSLGADAIDRERGVVLSEERVRNTYGLRRIKHLIGFLLPGTRIAERLPIGQVEVIEKAPRERFADLYERYYVPGRATLIVTGDVDADAIEAGIRAKFADWQPRQTPGPEVDFGTVKADRALATTFFHDPDVPTFITISALRPQVQVPDTALTRREDTIRALANAIVSRRLEKITRLPDSPVVSGSASHDEWFGVAEGPSIDMVARPETWEAALSLAEQELRRARQYGFTQAELDEQIANFRTNLANAAQQAATRETPRLADSLADAVNDDRVFTTPQSALERFESLAGTLTPAMVSAAFNAQWDGLNPLVHLSSSGEIADAEAAIRAVWDNSAAQPIAAPADTGTANFAYTDFGTPGQIVSDTLVEDLGVRLIRFDNNVMLNLKPTDFEDGVVHISLRVGGGELEFPAGEDGLSLMMQFFSDGGLEAHSADELQSILAGRSVSLGFGADEDSFGGYFVTTPQDFRLQLDVLAAYLTAPGFRPEADALADAQIGVFYPTLDSAPRGIFTRDVERIIRNGDKRYGFGPLDTLLSRSLGDLRPLLARALREGAIEIAIVGDFDPDAAIADVAATFGALPRRNAEPLPFAEGRRVSFPAGRDLITLVHKGQPYQALALMYWPTTDDSDIGRTRRINMLRAVFDLKLTNTLREALGATYSPGAGALSSSIYPGYGYLSASSEVEPDKVATVFSTVEQIAQRMADGEVSEDELARARKPILESIENQQEDNSAWLGAIAQAQTRPQDLENWRTRAAEYAAISVADVVAAAKTWLSAEPLRIRIVHESVAGQD